MDCTRAVADVRDNGLGVGNDRFGATETGGKREFVSVEFFFEDVKRVVVRAGEAVDGLMAIADGDEVARGGWIKMIRTNKTVVFAFWAGHNSIFKHPFSNLPPSGIGVLSFVDEHKIELWKGKVLL